MSDVIIRAENLGKSYNICHSERPERYTALRDVLSQQAQSAWRRLRRPFHRNRSTASIQHEEFWALKDVSFEIKRGDAVGIIGRNGAGKSTLLKILSRITEPTTGRVALRGRVASLLEVGTGFHPELTGRENIYLNGAILGMTRAEIARKFDEIVDFAGVEKFLDTPVKRYSSGMYVRLAFAVAAHLEPEILVVDEVLAVGDAEFQKKCLGKMQDVARHGRTVLFVSHQMLAIKSLCRRAFLLDDGEIRLDSSPDIATAAYLQSNSTERWEQVFDPADARTGGPGVRLHRASVIPRDRDSLKILTVDSSFNLEFEWEHNLPDTNLNLSIHVFTNDGACVLNTCTEPRVYSSGRSVSRCEIPGQLLNDGFFRFNLMIVANLSRILVRVEEVMSIEIHDNRRQSGWMGKWPGVVRPKLKWSSDVPVRPL